MMRRVYVRWQRVAGLPECRMTVQAVNERAVRDIVNNGPKTKKRLREPINGLTHLAAGLLASAGVIVLLVRATSAQQLVAFGIFGFI